MNNRDAWEAGYMVGYDAGRMRLWIDLTEDEYAELAVGYGDDLRALMEMTAAKLREKNE